MFNNQTMNSWKNEDIQIVQILEKNEDIQIVQTKIPRVKTRATHMARAAGASI